MSSQQIQDTRFSNQYNNYRNNAYQFSLNVGIAGNVNLSNLKIVHLNQSLRDITSILYIELPFTLETIGDSIFRGCSNLRTIRIPDSVSSIGAKCFLHCKSLASIHLPTNLRDIPYACFGDNLIKTIQIPNSVTKIGKRAFEYCKELRELVIPDSVKEIGKSCFSGCMFLSSVKLPSGITALHNRTFMGCVLEQIRLPPKLERIGESCFYMNPFNSIYIPDSVTYLGSRCFQGGCLHTIHLPSKLVKMGDFCLNDNPYLNREKLSIPSTLTMIGLGAFSQTASSRKIRIAEERDDDLENITDSEEIDENYDATRMLLIRELPRVRWSYEETGLDQSEDESIENLFPSEEYDEMSEESIE